MIQLIEEEKLSLRETVSYRQISPGQEHSAPILPFTFKIVNGLYDGEVSPTLRFEKHALTRD